MWCVCPCFFFNDTATTEIYTLSLHDALPICPALFPFVLGYGAIEAQHVVECGEELGDRCGDRKSTRLNSSHANISYAVFCLKKKQNGNHHSPRRMHRRGPTYIAASPPRAVVA